MAILLAARRLAVRAAGGPGSQRTGARRPGSRRRGRLPLVILTAGCLIAVGAAVSAAGAVPPGLRFAQAGHWIANPGRDSVFHVDGTGRVDARAFVPDMAAGSRAVQGPISGYVVSPRSVTRYGKEDLEVRERITPPVTDEMPVTIEARGGPYLVYRGAGSVVRLGDRRPTVIALGAPLGEPVVTSDGTLWLLRLDRDRLCHLAYDADSPTCPASIGAGHRGALTAVGQQAAFVDLDDGTVAPLDAAGLGRPRRLGVDLPADALVARNDVAGRLAVVDPAAGRLYLVDAVGLGTERAPAEPIAVPLPAGGSFATPVAGRSSVVLLDLRRHELRSYDATGRRVRVQRVPAERGVPSLSRGEDEQVYVDGGEGEHVLVVDDAGRITPVRLGSGAAATAPGAPGAEGRPAAGTARNPQPANRDVPGRNTARPAGTGASDPAPGGPSRPDPTRPDPHQGDPTQPGSTQPGPTQPGPTQPGAVPPGPVEPGRGQPDPTEPGPTAPGPTDPGPTGPAPQNPGPGDPGPDNPGPTGPAPDNPGPGDPGPTLPTQQPPTPPGVPADLTAAVGLTDVVVRWAAAADNGADIDAYRITWTPATHGGTVTVPGTARSTTLAGLVPSTRYTITVTAQNAAGRGTPATVQAVAPSRSISVSRGATTTYSNCLPPRCAFVNLELRGFPPHTAVGIEPWTDDWGQFNNGATLTTDEDGTLIMDDRFPCNDTGHYVWVVVDGVPSNRVLWEVP